MGERFRWIHDAWTSEKELHKQVIETHIFDRKDLDQILSEAPSFELAREQLSDFTPTGIEASNDAFFALFKAVPMRRSLEEMEPEHYVNHRVDEEMAAMPEIERLRRLSIGDEVQSAMAFEEIEPDLEVLFDRTRLEQQKAKELRQLLNKLRQASQRKQSVEEMIEQWKDSGSEASNDSSPEGEEDQQASSLPEELVEQLAVVEAELSEVDSQVQQALSEMEDHLDRVGNEARGILKAALGKAGDLLQGIHDVATSWGTDPGEITRLPAEERLELAKRLNSPEFRRLAALIGPMKNDMFTEQTRKTKHAREEVFDVGMGSDLSRLLPNELLALETNEDDFYRRYSEGKLLQYEMQGTERKARGGIIFCGDGSGSMSGDKEMWMKAVMACLMHIARQEGRPFYYIHFGSSTEIQLRRFETDSDYRIDRILDAIQLFFGGGTNFEVPMQLSMEILRERYAKDGAVNADVVFCTDGECHVTPSFMEEYLAESERLQFTTYGIAIPHPSEEVNPDGPLVQMSQGKVATVRDLLSGADIRHLWRQL